MNDRRNAEITGANVGTAAPRRCRQAANSGTVDIDNHTGHTSTVNRACGCSGIG